MSSSEPTAFRLAPLPDSTPETNQARERARVEGFMAGYAAGAEEAAATAAAQREAFAMQSVGAEAKRVELVTQRLILLDQAAAAARARSAPVVADAEDALYAAAVELATAIVGYELDQSELSALAAVRRALSDPTFDDVVTVRMNPTDVETLAGLPAPVPASVQIVADPDITAGDAVAEHPTGYLDARLTAAVDRARSVLAGTR